MKNRHQRKKQRQTESFEYDGERITLIHIAQGDSVPSFWKRNLFYEQNLLEKIKSLELGGTYVDIGAHMGNHTIFFDKFCDSDKVIAIEGNPTFFNILKKNTEANGCNKVQLINKIASDCSNKQRMMKYKLGNTGHCLVTDKSGDRKCIYVKNSTDTVDNLLQNEENVSLIKLDVENHEYFVLKGAQKIIEKFHPIIVIELLRNTYHKEILNFLKDKSYECDGISYGEKNVPTYVYKHNHSPDVKNPAHTASTSINTIAL